MAELMIPGRIAIHADFVMGAGAQASGQTAGTMQISRAMERSWQASTWAVVGCWVESRGWKSSSWGAHEPRVMRAVSSKYPVAVIIKKNTSRWLLVAVLRSIATWIVTIPKAPFIASTRMDRWK